MNILLEQCKNMIDYSLPPISNISNLLSLLFYNIEEINWIGLYFCDQEKNECILGPFQGKVACTRIPYNKGVVGSCASTQEIIVVDNVHTFKGHIACDCQSQSELVIPLLHNDTLYAVLDIDSPILSRFKNKEVNFFLEIAELINSFLPCEFLYKK